MEVSATRMITESSTKCGQDVQSLLDDATITQAETTVIVEAARVVCSLVHTGCTFDLDGNFVEDWDGKEKANQDWTTDFTENRHEEENNDIAAGISHSISAQKKKLPLWAARPKRSSQAAQSQPLPEPRRHGGSSMAQKRQRDHW